MRHAALPRVAVPEAVKNSCKGIAMIPAISGFLSRALRATVLSTFAFAALPGGANNLSANDQEQIIAVVQDQLSALAMDDAATAFSYAAPNIQQIMGSAENFLRMVRTQFAVVHRPSSKTFLNPVGLNNTAMLQVQLTDEDGDAWLAVYTLQKQVNNTWRITGCRLQLGVGTMV
jgi:hypothetical protein